MHIISLNLRLVGLMVLNPSFLKGGGRYSGRRILNPSARRLATPFIKGEWKTDLTSNLSA